MRIPPPKNQKIKVGNVVASLDWSPAFSPKWTGRFDLAQKYVDNEVLRLSKPYIPFQTGWLESSGRVIEPGLLEYPGPYAKFLYYGKVMVSDVTGSAWARKNETKHVINRDLTYNGAPQRGKRWIERMKADYKTAIIRGAERALRGEA